MPKLYFRTLERSQTSTQGLMWAKYQYRMSSGRSQDNQLIRNIKKMTIKELELIRDLGVAQSQQTIEKNVMKANKEVLSKMVDETRIEPSFTDTDIREYLKKVIEEVRRSEVSSK
jgi:hypothetical protein